MLAAFRAAQCGSASADRPPDLSRYPDGVSDYCMMLDAERVIDAAVASQGNDFTAGHVNHSR